MDTMPEPATADADETIRFRIQTIVNFLESGRKLPDDNAVKLAWGMAARAACEAVEKIFRGENAGGQD